VIVRVGALPGEPLAAAARFHAEVLPGVLSLLDPGGHGDDLLDLTLIFAPADHTHKAWRLAVIQSLARAHAPLRINAVASDQENAIAAAERYLVEAPGVTGQYWALDGNGAGEMLS
jgi:hypothetical protein